MLQKLPKEVIFLLIGGASGFVTYLLDLIDGRKFSMIWMIARISAAAVVAFIVGVYFHQYGYITYAFCGVSGLLADKLIVAVRKLDFPKLITELVQRLIMKK